MSRNRIPTGNLNERVVALETTTAAAVENVARHEERLDGLDAVLNRMRGVLWAMIVLWGLATSAYGVRFVQDVVSRPVLGSSTKP